VDKDPTPRVDVFVVAYERPEWIRESVTSLLRQTCRDFRVTVSDDSESDVVERALDDLRGDPHLRYVRHSRRLGMVGNWNDCILGSRAEFVAVFHDDDVYHPEILERSVALMDREPRVGFVHSAGVYAREDGTDYGPVPHRWPAVVPGADFVCRLARSKTSLVICPSVVARRRLYQLVGVFRELPGPGADKEMWMRMAEVCDVGFVEEPMIRNRIRTGERANFHDWTLPGLAMMLDLSGGSLPQSYGVGLPGRLWGEIRFFARRNAMTTETILGLLRRRQVQALADGWPLVAPFVSPPLRFALRALALSPRTAHRMAGLLALLARLRRLGRAPVARKNAS
jgi:hypothetical protein